MPPEEDPRNKRIQEIATWLQYFQDNYREEFDEDLVYVGNAVELLNSSYWEIIEERIRPYLIKSSEADKIDHHKIISVLEICVMILQPIEHEDKETKADLNAQLALFIARAILLSWNEEISELAYLPSFEREHLTWLKCVDTEGYPYFSNAATWCLFEQLCIEKNRKAQNIIRQSENLLR